jgi:hypothetical protein
MQMVIVKGIGLGFIFFGITLVVYISARIKFILQSAPPGAGLGIDFISMLKHEPAVFAAFLACVALGVSVVAMWPRK